MHRSGHDISQRGAAVLLTLFVVGGLLGPAVHRAHHGLTWARLHTDTAASCDHAEHGVSFEVTLPALLDDDCLLCVRHLVPFDAAHAAPTTYHGFSGYALPVQAAPEPPHFTLLPIRGPPHAS